MSGSNTRRNVLDYVHDSNDHRVKAILMFLLYVRDRHQINFDDERVSWAFQNAKITIDSTPQLEPVSVGHCQICLSQTGTAARLRCDRHMDWEVIHVQKFWSPFEGRRYVVRQLLQIAKLPEPDDRVFEDDVNFNNWVSGITLERRTWQSRMNQGIRHCVVCNREAMESVSHTDESGTVTWVRWICNSCLMLTNPLRNGLGELGKPEPKVWMIRPHIWFRDGGPPGPTVEEALAILEAGEGVTLTELDKVVKVMLELGWEPKSLASSLNYALNGVSTSAGLGLNM